MKRLLALALLAAACGRSPESAAPRGGVDSVVIVMRGDEPLPFDPRGGRLTIASRELARVLGHPITLELEQALSPPYRASFEESVIASLEGLTREMVVLKRDSPDVFAASARLRRVVCRYDAVAKRSRGALVEDASAVEVFAPPDEYPILERGVVSSALFDAFVAGEERRWGNVAPEDVPPGERAAYFAFLTRTRPGYGYVYGRVRPGADRAALYGEIVAKVARLHPLLEAGAPLEKEARAFLLAQLPRIASPDRPPRDAGAVRAYVAWLAPRASRMRDEDRLAVARAVFEHRSTMCGLECAPDAALPGFDRFAFGMTIVDEWARAGHPVAGPPGPRTELWKTVVCPAARSVGPSTAIRYGCSDFFARALHDEADRKRLRDAALARRDPALVDAIVLNLGYGAGADALAFVESLSADDALLRRGMRVLFDDLARRDDVRNALESAALRWWRDAPSRRGAAVYVFARRYARLDASYGDEQWKRLVPELGGPLSRDVYASYLAEGPHAIELAPTLWPALAKGAYRAELLARALPELLARDRQARTSRGPKMLAALRGRLCAERDAAGMAAVRAEVARWVRAHPDDSASLSNALSDLSLDRCRADDPGAREPDKPRPNQPPGRAPTAGASSRSRAP